jgi:hypothetical protein
MKLLILSLSMLLTLASFAQAKTVKVQGDDARSIMEAFASAGLPVTNIDEEWSGKVLTVEVKDLTCHYSVAYAPDEWMTDITCVTDANNTILPNSLAIAKAVSRFVAFEGAAGNRYLTANSIKCGLKYNERQYACLVDADYIE